MRPMQTPPVVKNLLIINILMLIADWVLQSRFGIDLTYKLGLFYYASEHFEPYQYVTHMFMHGDITHLFFNMFALWMFGRVLEQVWGSKRFLFYYLVTGLGAAALHTFVNHLQMSQIITDSLSFINTPSPELFREFIKEHLSGRTLPQLYDFLTEWDDNPASVQYSTEAIAFVNKVVSSQINIPTVGASGAVFGVLLAFGMTFPNTVLMLIFPPIPMKAKYFVILYGALELYLGLTQPGSNIAHFAHLGGMLFGFLLIKYWNKNRMDFL